jgi:heptosyltransferase-2
MAGTVTMEATTGMRVNISAKPWNHLRTPRRILAIRMQAMGDLVGCLPYLQYLRDTIPQQVPLDLLTREETAGIPQNIHLFDKVYAIGGGRNFKKQVIHGALMMPALLRNRYDVVLDLQNHQLSRFMRKALMPQAWTEFDRFSPIGFGERYQLTIEAAGLGTNKANYRFRLKDDKKALEILRHYGWNSEEDLIVLNPAGAFETRNWSLSNYRTFARLWLQQFPRSRFLVLGTGFIEAKANWLKEQLGDRLINLTGKTLPFEAFAILQKVKLVLSEDSGLMHMAWCSGVPTIGLFGGTRTDWTKLSGDHTVSLDAADLACGGCMKETCRYGDVHCLTRYLPDQVFHHARSLLEKLKTQHTDHIRW